MLRSLKVWLKWMLLFLCACSAAVPGLPERRKDADAVVVRPAGYQPVPLSREEFQEGMRKLFSRGPLPGA
ncbi:MAG TPA: hypothetical protein VND93_02205, partial [Myxococcales bacterium]|nr:hypothetical protein [Myxococcales bacterium]